MKTALLAIIGLGVLGVVLLNNPKHPSTLQIGNTIINIEIADTDTERTKGLSGRESLGTDEGLLFVFDKPGTHGFWMKDMRFAIDIIWIDENKKIIGVEENVAPDTFPKVLEPPTPILYVLETAAGFLVKNKIKIGDFVDF